MIICTPAASARRASSGALSERSSQPSRIFSVTGTDTARDRGLDQRQGVIEIAHQRGAGLAAGDVAGRTAHVDVDDVGAGGFRDPRALGHPVRLAAGKLNDMRADARGLAAQQRHRAAVDEIVAGGHFGDDETRAKCSGQTPERRVGDARHRRKHDPVGDRDVTNLQWLTL